MTEQEVETLEQIWEGKTSWGPEWEQVMDNLAAGGYIDNYGRLSAPIIG